MKTIELYSDQILEEIKLDKSLKDLWVEYFNSINFKKVDVIPQVDIP